VVHVSLPSPDASVFARPTQPPSVTSAIFASGAPLTSAVTATSAPGGTVNVSPGPAVELLPSRDALSTNDTALDSAT
jgi:hypothetical protein